MLFKKKACCNQVSEQGSFADAQLLQDAQAGNERCFAGRLEIFGNRQGAEVFGR